MIEALVFLAIRLSADQQPDVTAPFLQFGAIGALAVLLLWFALVTVRDLRAQRDACQKQVQEERDEAQARETRQQEKYEKLLADVLPLATEANRVLGEAITEIRRIREGR